MGCRILIQTWDYLLGRSLFGLIMEMKSSINLDKNPPV